MLKFLTFFLTLFLFQNKPVYSINNDTTPGKISKKNLSLSELHEKFSSYTVQSIVTSCNLFKENNLENWKNENESEVEESLEKIENLILNENHLASESEIKEIKLLFHSALTNDVEKKCVGPNKFLKAKFVSLKNIMSNNLLVNDCDPDLEDQPRSISIFALSTIFIDADIDRPGERLTFMAPKWEILDSRLIDLSGSNAHDLKVPESEADDASTKCIAQPGKNGEPGSAGGPGGHFWGIGNKFVNDKNLKIVANGGQGGPGEDGCIGRKGRDGVRHSFVYDSSACRQYQKEKLSVARVQMCNCLKKHYYACSFDSKVCTYPGTAGKTGEKGGEGGHEGSGGQHGLIEISGLEDKSKISEEAVVGKNGVEGSGGGGGIGGQNGEDLSFNCFPSVGCASIGCPRIFQSARFPGISDDLCLNDICVSKYNENKNQGPRGPDGISGGNDKDIEVPTEMKQIYRPSDIVNEYKYFLHSNLLNYFESDNLKKFYDKIENDKIINSKYDPLGFFYEQQRLEKEFFELNDEVDLLPHFKSLKRRMEEYLKTFEENKESHNALKYLIGLITERIDSLDSNKKSSLITTVKEYISPLKDSATKLKDSFTLKVNLENLNKARLKQLKGLNSKIADANQQIDNFLNNKIKQVFNELDNNIVYLVERVAQDLEQNEIEREENEKNRKKLENMLMMKKVFNFVEFVGRAVGVLGTYGAIAGNVITTVSTGVRAVALNEGELDLPTIARLGADITNKVRDGKDLLSNLANAKIQKYKDFIYQMDEEIAEHKDRYDEKTLNDIHHFKERFNEVEHKVIHNYNFMELKKFNKEFKPVLKKMKENARVNQHSASTQHGIIKVDALVNFFNDASEYARNEIDLFEKYKDDKAALDSISQAIVENQKQHDELKGTQHKIHDVLGPMINSFHDDITTMQKDFSRAKCKSTLDVMIKKLNDNLKGIKDNIKNFMEDSDLKDEAENFQFAIDDLGETMETLIKVYEFIQDTQQDKKNANFISSQFKTVVMDFNVTDSNSKIWEALLDVKTLLASNSLIKEFKTFVDPLKMFLFPLPFDENDFKVGNSYPISLTLPHKLYKKALDIVQHISFIENQLKKSKTYHLDFGYSSHAGDFNSDKNTIKPFFVWKNEDYKEHILKLISGEKVMFTADIKKTEIDYDAVKFRKLNLKLKTKSSNMQSKLNNVLKKFKIVLHHVGDCYYRFNGEVTAIPTENFTISYNIEINDEKESVQMSKDYLDILNGDYVLSPYGSWEIKLMDVTKSTFKDFMELKDEIDLELIGTGSFLIKNGHRKKKNPTVQLESRISVRNCIDLNQGQK